MAYFFFSVLCIVLSGCVSHVPEGTDNTPLERPPFLPAPSSQKK